MPFGNSSKAINVVVRVKLIVHKIKNTREKNVSIIVYMNFLFNPELTGVSIGRVLCSLFSLSLARARPGCPQGLAVASKAALGGHKY